jgi:phage terminase large subunit
MVVEACVKNPDWRVVCIREMQRSLKFSAKTLIESKIHEMGVASHFEILQSEIRNRKGRGIIIFEGMQDHTADSLKSLEGFHRAWVEEAQSLSQRSLDLLLPTIRAEGSEIWFTWNPTLPDDAVDKFLVHNRPENSIVVEANYKDNPWCPQEMYLEAQRVQRSDSDAYAHIWLGQYNRKSASQVLLGKWRVDEFEPLPTWSGPYFGADWGFSQDPTVLVKFWVGDNRLWVEYESGNVGVDMNDIPLLFDRIPGARDHVIRADNSRPETISHVANQGFRIEAAVKWNGSVEDGVAWIRSHEEIVIHERCTRAAEEARLWSYKIDRLSGDPLPRLDDNHNHVWDAIRYGAAPMIKFRLEPGFH